MIKSLLTKSVNLIPWSLRSHIKRIPIVKQIQKAIVNRVLNNSEFDHTINAGPAKGLKYPIVLPQDKLLWTGTWESDFAEALAEKIKTGDVCFDIGSHRGFIAGIMAVSNASEIHCFEPNPENVTQIEKMIGLNPNHKFQLHQVAVSDSDGNAVFKIMPESSMGKLEGSGFQETATGADEISVRVRTLDSMIAENAIPVPDLIKIDVEGAELGVLGGASELLKNHKPLICLEFHSPELLDSCCEILHAAGYSTELLQWKDRASLPANAVGHVIGA